MSRISVAVLKGVVFLFLYWNWWYFSSRIDVSCISVAALKWVIFLLRYWNESYFCFYNEVTHFPVTVMTWDTRCFRYPEYLFISNKEFSQSAHQLSSRYTESSLRGIILDIHFLSLTNYLVCGFSSNVRVRDYLANVHLVSYTVALPFSSYNLQVQIWYV